MANAKAVNDSITILKPSECFDAIRVMTSTKTALFIWGPPGIAKSAVGQQAATAANCAFADIRLSQMDPTDLRGMPFRIEENGRSVGVAWSAPLVLPRDLDIQRIQVIDAIETIISFKADNPRGSNGIHYVKKPQIEAVSLTKGAVAEIVSQNETSFVVRLVDEAGETVAGKVHYNITGEAEVYVAFEELNSAPPSVLASAYQLILDRRQGDYIMPEKVRCIAMGNRSGDRGVTFELPKPLSNRFDHIEMTHDYGDWSVWAMDSMINPLILGYLEEQKQELFNFDPTSKERAFATPRSWAFVSAILDSKEPCSNKVLSALICGAVGDGIGIKFNNYRKFAEALPKNVDVLSGKIKDLEEKHRKNVSLAYTLVLSLCFEIRHQHDALERDGVGVKAKDKRRDEWYARFDTMLQFWMKNFSPEINVMGMRLLVKTHEIPMSDRTRVPTIGEFTKRFGSLLRQAS